MNFADFAVLAGIAGFLAAYWEKQEPFWALEKKRSCQHVNTRRVFTENPQKAFGPKKFPQTVGCFGGCGVPTGPPQRLHTGRPEALEPGNP
jgi:hypothetical protein